MNQRQAPSRARYIAIMVITILVLSFGIGYWLSVAHQAALAPYRSWFPVFNLYVIPIIYIALGIFGTAQGLFKMGVKNSRIGPTRRIVLTVIGLFLLILGLTKLLLHW